MGPTEPLSSHQLSLKKKKNPRNLKTGKQLETPQHACYFKWKA